MNEAYDIYDIEVVSSVYAELANLTSYRLKMEEALKCEQNNIHHIYNVGAHIISVTDIAKTIAPYNSDLILAAALHDIEKPSCKTSVDGIDKFIGHAIKSAETAKKILDDLAYTMNMKYRVVPFDTDYIVWLVKHHEVVDKMSEKTMRKWCREYDTLEDLWSLRQCDLLGQSMYQRSDKLEILAYNMKLEESVRQLPEFQQIEN